MEQHTLPAKRIHPLMAAAAVSVMLVSLAGVAAMTGILPSSHGTAAPSAGTQTPLAAEQPPGPTPADYVAQARAPAQAAYAPAPAAYAPKPVQHKAAPVHVAHATQTQTQAQPHSTPAVREQAAAPVVCSSCGRVESVQAIESAAPPSSGVGIAAGAVLGGLLGHQIGGGHGKQLATVAGVVGGGFAGNEVERRTRASTTYQVRVHMEDGSTRTFPYSEAPGWNAGDRVQIQNGSLTARG